MGDKPSNGDDEQSQNETKRSEEMKENKCQPSVNYDERNLQTGDMQTKMDDVRSQNKRKRCDEKGKNKVLVYNTEEGETTICFIEALKKHLGVFDFQEFHAADDEEKNTLSIIAVVRHTIIRIDDVLKEVKLQFENDNVDDLKRVFVTYFYVNRSDASCKLEIKKISRQFNFAKIVPMNFIDTCLNNRKYFGLLGGCLKPDNEKSLQELKDCILSRMKLCVNVYGAGDSDRIKAFLAELDQKISSSIELQPMRPLEELINETSPTLICSTGDVKECVEECLRNLKEKDLKVVFLCHIIDVENISTKTVKHDSADDTHHEEQNPSSASPAGTGNNTAQNAENMPCKMSVILYYDRKFKIDFDFKKQFETFVCTWSEEIKSPSE